MDILDTLFDSGYLRKEERRDRCSRRIIPTAPHSSPDDILWPPTTKDLQLKREVRTRVPLQLGCRVPLQWWWRNVFLEELGDSGHRVWFRSLVFWCGGFRELDWCDILSGVEWGECGSFADQGLDYVVSSSAVFSSLDRIESTSQEYDKGRYDTYADSKSDRKVGGRVSIMSGMR